MILPKQELFELVDSKYYGPCSVDLRLGTSFAFIKKDQHEIDTKHAEKVEYEKFDTQNPVLLQPSQFALATTAEEVFVPNHLAAYVEGRSSIGRLGLQVQNAGFIDSGFNGEITLELYNQAPVPIKIYPGMRICQIVYMKLTEITTTPYHGKYLNQKGAQISKFEGIE